MLQEENEARQECSRLLQRQGRRGGMLLQGRFLSDAEQETRQLKRQLTFAGQ